MRTQTRRFPFAWIPMLLLGAAALCPGVARAQTPTREQPFPKLDDARRWGPFLVDVGFVLENFGYDDNIFLIPSSQVTPENPKVGDWVVRIAPEIKAQSSFTKRSALTIRDKIGGEMFLENSELDHWDNEAEGQFDLVLGPVLLTTRARYASMTWRPNTEISNRVHQRDALLAQGARLFLGPRTDLFAEYQRSRFRYDDPGTLYAIDENGDGTAELVPIEVVLDRDQDRVRGELGWRATGATRIFLRVERTEATFENRIRDSRELRGMLGFEFSPVSRLSGRFAYGRSRFEEIDNARGLDPYDGPVAEASLTFRPTGASRFTAKWDRRLYFSTYEQNLYYVSNQRGITADWYFGTAWGVQGGYTLTNDDYPEPTTLGYPRGVKRADKINERYIGLLFRTRGGVELGVKYGVRDRTSNMDGLDDNQRYFTTTGRYAF